MSYKSTIGNPIITGVDRLLKPRAKSEGRSEAARNPSRGHLQSKPPLPRALRSRLGAYLLVLQLLTPWTHAWADVLVPRYPSPPPPSDQGSFYVDSLHLRMPPDIKMTRYKAKNAARPNAYDSVYFYWSDVWAVTAPAPHPASPQLMFIGISIEDDAVAQDIWCGYVRHTLPVYPSDQSRTEGGYLIIGEVNALRLGKRIAVDHQTFFSTPIALWSSAESDFGRVDPEWQKHMEYKTSIALTKYVMLSVRFSDYDLNGSPIETFLKNIEQNLSAWIDPSDSELLPRQSPSFCPLK